MSQLSQFINQILKEKRYYKKIANMYRDLYHGTFPSDNIHVKKSDWLKVVNELRELRKLKRD